MRYITFDGEEHESYDVAILVPSLNAREIQKHYVDPYFTDKSKVIAFSLHQNGKKTPAKEQKEYLDQLLPILSELKVKYLVVGDGDYFKTIAKAPKSEATLGYVLPVGYKPSGGTFTGHCVYVPSFTRVWTDPERITGQIQQGLRAVISHWNGAYQQPGANVIQFAAYPSSASEIAQWLQRLIAMDRDLTADIEGFSLKHVDAGIGTISFAWSQHEGIAFAVDLGPDGEEVRSLLRDFFTLFQKRLIWHHASYDLYVLVYQLFMQDILDREGLLYGLSVMCRNFEDTKIIAYLATNTVAGNNLSLKDIAQEFAGDYAVEEIEDIRSIPLDKLLQYNLVDTCSTWYAYNKYWDRMIQDEQYQLYLDLFKPALIDIIEMQLTGMPLNMERVQDAKSELTILHLDALARIRANPHLQAYEEARKVAWAAKMNATWKKKRATAADCPEKEYRFNPNSDPQIREFIYNFLELPVLDLTKSKQASTKAKHLKKLINYTQNPDIIGFIEALMDYADVDILLTTFIPAFEGASLGPDGWHYLFGFFNLGGTVSGRLSSSNPNLQNIPANSKYAKLIKLCFEAPPGWLFAGLDFASLEDRISALTTKDPNKLKVYTDGYDGHCLRAYAYFKDQMSNNINPDDVESINSIAEFYPELRQKGKNPTFALTYQGTYKTLMKNYNFTEALSRQLETAYGALYATSIQWVSTKLDQASKDGYITGAFGLRIRTPLLKQVVRGTRYTPYEAEAEGRTAGNALGQSWCLLNSRAGVEFNGKVRTSDYRLDIKPCAQIHDAQYHMIRNQMNIVLWYNEHLVKASQWQDHPDIWHPEVKLFGEVDIFYPNWAYPMTIPNGANDNDVEACIAKHRQKLAEKGIAA